MTKLVCARSPPRVFPTTVLVIDHEGRCVRHGFQAKERTRKRGTARRERHVLNQPVRTRVEGPRGASERRAEGQQEYDGDMMTFPVRTRIRAPQRSHRDAGTPPRQKDRISSSSLSTYSLSPATVPSARVRTGSEGQLGSTRRNACS